MRLDEGSNAISEPNDIRRMTENSKDHEGPVTSSAGKLGAGCQHPSEFIIMRRVRDFCAWRKHRRKSVFTDEDRRQHAVYWRLHLGLRMEPQASVSWSCSFGKPGYSRRSKRGWPGPQFSIMFCT